MSKKKSKNKKSILAEMENEGLLSPFASLEKYQEENLNYLDCTDDPPSVYKYSSSEQSPLKPEPVSLPEVKPRIQKSPLIIDPAEYDNELLNFPTDDIGNGDRFEYIYGDGIRYNVDTGNWHNWNGKYWMEDKLFNIRAMAEEMVKQYRNATSRFESSKNPIEKRLFKHGQQSCYMNRIKALIELLKHRFSMRKNDFDQQPDKITVSNGIVDLRTGRLHTFDSSLLLTQFVDIEYIQHAYIGSRFSRFLKTICGDDEELQYYLQTLYGYALTAETREQVICILYGRGANGKTTFHEAIDGVIDCFIRHMPIEVLLNVNKSIAQGRASSELAQCYNKRLLFVSESEDKGAFRESVVKLLTGGSKISVRNLFENSFEFKPEFTVFLDTNYLPHVRGADYAIWRRLKVIEFKVTFDDSEKDIRLPEVLGTKNEKEAILAWLIEGAVRYYNEGLTDCRSVAEATDRYFRQENTIGSFIRDCIIDDDSVGYKVSASKLYKFYEEYCLKNSRTPENITNFGKGLKLNGYTDKRLNTGYFYRGIRLKSGGVQCV